VHPRMHNLAFPHITNPVCAGRFMRDQAR
jgi:hypothetical protein